MKYLFQCLDEHHIYNYSMLHGVLQYDWSTLWITNVGFYQ